MAVNTIVIDCKPASVWQVLADPSSYEHWVVGSSEIRKVEGSWPEPGAIFHHTQGVPKVGLKDTTRVLESQSAKLLRLRVQARPIVIGEVTLELEDTGGRTCVTMTERPIGGLMKLVPSPITDVGLHVRNAESLRRLANLVRE